jgi:signal transduction histidine kinase
MLGALGLFVARAQADSRRALEERFNLRGALAASFGRSYASSLIAAERRQAEARLTGRHVDAEAFASVVEAFDFEAAVLLDSKGRVIHVWPRAPRLIGTPLTAKYAHLRAAVAGRVGISSVVPSAARQMPIVAFATPFRSPYGRRVFSGAFSVARTPLADYLRNALPIGGSQLYVIDDRGTIVGAASGTGAATLVERDRRLAAAVVRQQRGSYEGRAGKWYFTSARVAGTPWRVVAAVPEDELLAPVRGASAHLPWLLFVAFALATIGLLALVVQVMRDRTRVAAANAALAERNDELHKLDRLKDEFVALVSHELRTPLTSIIGYVSLLLRSRAGDLRPEQRRYLDVVARNARRLGALVGDLLFAAKADAGKLTLERETVALDRVVRDAAESAGVLAREKDVTFEVAANGPVFVYADAARLVQLFDNLTSNAIKFTPEGGRVELRLAVAGDRAIVEVEDTGIGIPEDEIEQLFQRFFRASTATAREIQGTGLGLSVAKTIVELHGGTIAVASEVGRGTSVRVELPLAAAGALAA